MGEFRAWAVSGSGHAVEAKHAVLGLHEPERAVLVLALRVEGHPQERRAVAVLRVDDHALGVLGDDHPQEVLLRRGVDGLVDRVGRRVLVELVDIGIAVMQQVVLNLPGKGTSPDQIHGITKAFIDPLAPGNRSVVGVVHHSKTNAGRSKAHDHIQHQGPGARHNSRVEHNQRHQKHRQHDYRLDGHAKVGRSA